MLGIGMDMGAISRKTKCLVLACMTAIPTSYFQAEVLPGNESVPERSESRDKVAPKVEKQIREYSIRVGELEFGILFEDYEIPRELRDLIVREIELIHSQLDNIYMSELRDGARKYSIGGDLILSKHIIYRGGQDLYMPKIFADSNVGDLLKIDSRFFLVVPRELIERYEKAYDFLIANDEEFTELLQFIGTINQLQNINGLSDSKVEQMFFLSDPRMRTTADISTFRKNLESLLGYEIVKPSILEFQILELEGDSLLFCSILLKEKGSQKVADEIGVGKVGNQWRFVF